MNIKIRVKSVLILSCAVVFFSGCASMQGDSQGQGSKMAFALIGDMPYNARMEKESLNVLKAINAEDLAFVVHIGDLQWDGIVWKKTTMGLPPCADETYDDRLEFLQKFEHPVVFVPGDNDWTDCHRAKPRAYDSLERLAKLRNMFYPDENSLGQRSMKLTRQSDNPRYARFVENVRWVYGDVMFVTQHMIGSNNNLGRNTENDAEYAERNDANMAWMKEAFDTANRNGNKAIMIVGHANPFFETNWAGVLKKRYLLKGLKIKPPEEKASNGFDDFIAALEQETLNFGRPVVYVHGDTHTFRIDKPLVGTPKGKRFIENFTRVETFGAPNTHWIRVTMEHNDPNVFQFRQEIIKENRARH
jgi:hypothetical protein